MAKAVQPGCYAVETGNMQAGAKLSDHVTGMPYPALCYIPKDSLNNFIKILRTRIACNS